MDAPKGTIIAYATAPGQTAADGMGTHGLYTENLLKAMEEPGLTVENVFKKTRIAVAGVSNDAQVPWENTSLTGDFYFHPGRPHATVGGATISGEDLAEAERDRRDLAFWQTIKATEDAGRFLDYLSRYPQGHFTGAAQLKLEAIRAGKEVRPPTETHLQKVPEKQGHPMVLWAGSLSEPGCLAGVHDQARLKEPSGIETAPDGRVFIADSGNSVIRVVDIGGSVRVLAGQMGKPGHEDGDASQGRLTLPRHLLLLADGALLVADSGAHAIRRVKPDGFLDTFAGQPGKGGGSNGNLRTAQFLEPSGIARDERGNLFVADTGNHVIRKINPSGVVNTFAGRQGSAGDRDGRYGDARFNRPTDIVAQANGDLLVLDGGNGTIRRIDPDGRVTTLPLSHDLAFSGLAAEKNGLLWVIGAGGQKLYRLEANNRLTLVAELSDPLLARSPLLGVRDWSNEGVLFTTGQGVVRLDPPAR